MNMANYLVCVGASAGGVPAIQKFLLGFTEPPPFAIAIVQHMPEHNEVKIDLIYKIAGRCAVEAIDKMPLEKGCVYFAPGGYHMLIEKDFSISMSQEEPEHFARPSINIFFESVARSIGPAACGVLLTGANADGARGIKLLQEAGAKTIVQNPRTAEVPFMPQAALDIMTPDFILDLENISAKLLEFAGEGPP